MKRIVRFPALLASYLAVAFCAAADTNIEQKGIAVKFGGQAWTIHSSDRILLQYLPNPAPFKPYVSELRTPSGVQVLRDSPADHKHHHGLMFALGVNGNDFWGEERGAGKQVARGKPVAFTHFEQNIRKSGFAQTLDWIDARGNRLLVEKRSVAMSEVDVPQPVTVVTWISDLTAADGIASVKLHGHHYYGLGMRFVQSMDSGGRFFNSTGKLGDIVRGSERLVAAKWCAYTAKADGKPVTVAIFDHPTNRRYPNKMFTMTPPFAYLSATLNLYQQPLELKAGEHLKLVYAVALWDGETTSEQVAALYRQWTAAKPETVKIKN